MIAVNILVSPMADQNSNGDIDVTLKIVMDHMQAGFSSMRISIGKLEKRIDRLERKVDFEFADLKDRWRWLDSHDIPKRVSQLEDKVFAGIDP